MATLDYPGDVMQIIASMLALSDLVALYATRNRRIQVLLTRPSLISILYIERKSKIWSFDTRLFLSSIRDVGELRFGTSASLMPNTLPLLKTLNPVTIKFGCAPLSKAAVSILNTYNYGSPTKEERRLGRLMTAIFLPKFSRLTPRLETLELPNTVIYPSSYEKTIDWVWNNPDQLRCDRSSLYRFPPSLTSIELSVSGFQVDPLVDALPSTMLSLTLTNVLGSLNIRTITSRLPQLNHLSIEESFSGYLQLVWQSSAGDSFPKALTSLAISCSQIRDVIDLMVDSQISQSSLASFKLTITNYFTLERSVKPIDFRYLLPPTITKLDLKLKSTDAPAIVSLPVSLKHLSIQRKTPDPKSMDTLTQLTNLQTLELDAAGNRIYGFRSAPGAVIVKSSSSESDLASTEERGLHLAVIPCGQLARSITHLTVRQFSYSLTEDDIYLLPPALVFLSVSRFNLNCLPTLRSVLPRCFLQIEDPIEVATLPNCDLLCLPEFGWKTRSLDVFKWANAVAKHYQTQFVRFKLSLSGDPRSAYKNLRKLKVDLPSQLTGPITLEIPSFFYTSNMLLSNCCLRKLVLNLPKKAAAHGSFSLSVLPASLTHLELYCPSQVIQMGMLPSLLCYLATDTTAKFLALVVKSPSLKHLDAPNWNFMALELRKWDLSAFDRLSTQTHGLMDHEVPGFLESTKLTNPHDQLALTINFLPTGIMLSKSITDVDYKSIQTLTADALSLLYPKHFTFIPEKIHNVRHGTIFLPPSLTRVTLSGHPYRSLFISSTETFPSPAFKLPPQITHLEVHHFGLVATKNVRFPSTLTYLHLKTNQGYLESYPPKLKTLLLEWDCGYSTQRHNFNIADIPASVEHLALAGYNFSLPNSEMKSKKLGSKWRLLSSLLIFGASEEAESVLLRRFDVGSIPNAHFARRKQSHGSQPDLSETYPNLRLSYFKEGMMSLIMYEFSSEINAKLELTPRA